MPLEKRRNALPGGQILLNNNNEGEPMEMEMAEKELMLDCPRSDEEFPSGSSTSGAGCLNYSNANASSNSSDSSSNASFPPFPPNQQNELMALLIGQIQEQMNLLGAIQCPNENKFAQIPPNSNVPRQPHLPIPGIDGPSYPLFPSASAPNLHLPIRQRQICCSSSTNFYNPMDSCGIIPNFPMNCSVNFPQIHQNQHKSNQNQLQSSKFPAANSIDEKAISEALLTSPHALAISGLLPPGILNNAQFWDQWLCQLATNLSAPQWQQFWRQYAALFGLQSLPSHLSAFFQNSSLSQLGAFSSYSSPFKPSNLTNDFPPNHRLRRSGICDLGVQNSELNFRIRDIFCRFSRIFLLIKFL